MPIIVYMCSLTGAKLSDPCRLSTVSHTSFTGAAVTSGSATGGDEGGGVFCLGTSECVS